MVPVSIGQRFDALQTIVLSQGFDDGAGLVGRPLTQTPSQMERADVEALRAAGFEDADVLAIAEVTSYYAYANRIADGLGIELEDD